MALLNPSHESNTDNDIPGVVTQVLLQLHHWFNNQHHRYVAIFPPAHRTSMCYLLIFNLRVSQSKTIDLVLTKAETNNLKIRISVGERVICIRFHTKQILIFSVSVVRMRNGVNFHMHTTCLAFTYSVEVITSFSVDYFRSSCKV